MNPYIIRNTPYGDVSFSQYSIDAKWNECGGIYMFAKPGILGIPVIQYVGLCDSFKSRMCSHERWDEAKRAGATCVYAVKVVDATIRADLEKYLIGRIKPPLNTQHVTSGFGNILRRPT